MHPQWKEVCNLMFATDGRGVLNGEFNLANGVRFAVSTTAYGDGIYFDRKGRQYPVDAGLIGCIRVEDVYDPEWYLEGVNVIEFDRPFQIVYNEGFIRFIDDYNTILVSIDTDPSDDDQEEEEV
jgi:hypothetical protein